MTSGKQYVALPAFLFILTFFTKGLNVSIPGLGDIDLYGYPMLFLIFILYPKSYRLAANSLILFGLIVVLGVFSKLLLSFSILPLIKQVIPAFVIYVAAFSFMSKYDVKYLFRIYGRVILVLSLFGILQVLLSFISIDICNEDRFLVNIRGIRFMRLSSLLPEPSHFAILCLPYFIYSFIINGLASWRTTVVGIAILLTFSLSSYVAVFISILIIFFKKINLYAIVGLVLLLIGFSSTYFYFEPIRYRIDETIAYMDINDFNDNTNATTFSFISNLYAALNSVKRNMLFGAGIGGHEESYYDFFKEVNTSNFQNLYDRHSGLNAKSGHSLAIRILSEFGLFGVILVFWFIRKYRVTGSNIELYAISMACISYLIARCFKLGGYFDYGIYFFLTGYYQTYAQQRNIEKNTYNIT